MILARKTVGAILFGFGAGAVCGAAISLVATFFGPHASALDSTHPVAIFRLAATQGSLVGAFIGLLLWPLAYFGLARGVSPLRIAASTGAGTLLLGGAVGLVAGPAAGLAGGILGFFVVVVALSAAPTTIGAGSRASA